MTDNDIRRALAAAAPKEPGFEGWGDQVRKGHRRRRTAISVVTALGLVALAVPMALQVSNLGNTPIQATPSPTPTATSPVPSSTRPVEPSPTLTPEPNATISPSSTSSLVSQACQKSVGVVTALPDGKLPAGATRVWLCDGDQEPAVPIYGPPEPLTSKVDQVVSAFNALPVVAKQECGTGDYEQAYTLVVEYPDGKSLSLSGITHGCKTINDGTQYRGQADAFFKNTVELFKQQRAEQPYELRPGETQVCTQGRSFMGMSLAAAVRGFMCGVPEGSKSMYVKPIQRALPQDLVQRIIETARAEAKPMPATEPYPWSQSIVLLSRYGDPITMYRSIDTFYWSEGDKISEWVPNPELLGAINQHTTGMLKGDPPTGVTEDPCGGDYQPAQGPIANASTAVLCLPAKAGEVQMGIALPEPLFKALVDGMTANIGKVSPANNDVTGAAIRVQTDSGSIFLCHINTDGTIVWSDYELKETAWQPTPEFRQWLIDNAVPLRG